MEVLNNEYTHIFTRKTRELININSAPKFLNDKTNRLALSEGFVLVNSEKVQMDKHGQPCYQNGRGWSYGHVQSGYICAGAGGVNSMRVIPLF